MDDKRPAVPQAGETARKRQELETQRLARALRDNLARRKAQSRGRAEGDAPPET